MHMLYSLNRWENRALVVDLADSMDFVVADRYTPSNLAYGVARGLNLDWLRGLDNGLPKTDLVIVLDVPVDSSFARKVRNRDVHEKDEKFLTRVRRTYKLLGREHGWKIVNATGPVQEVHAAVWGLVSKRFKLHGRSQSFK